MRGPLRLSTFDSRPSSLSWFGESLTSLKSYLRYLEADVQILCDLVAAPPQLISGNGLMFRLSFCWASLQHSVISHQFSPTEATLKSSICGTRYPRCRIFLYDAAVLNKENKKIPCLARFAILCAGLKLKTQNLLFVTFWSDWLVEFQLLDVTWLPLLPPPAPLPCSPIPWGKVPSKNLLGHQNLIGPTSRPASHWLLHLSTLFRGSILLRLQHLRARRSCDICLGNYI